MLPFPKEVLIKNQLYINPKISPNGERLAYIKNDTESISIIVRNLKSNKPENVIFRSREPIKDYFWTGDKAVIINQDNHGNEKYQLTHIKIDSLKQTNITSQENHSVEILNHGMVIKGKMYLAITHDSNEYADVYSLDLDTYEMKKVMANPGYISDWFIDMEGTPRGRYISRDDGGIDFVIFNKEKDPKTIAKWDVDDIFSSDFITFSKDNQNVYIKDSSITGTSSLTRINLINGKRENLFNDKTLDIEKVGINPVNGGIDAISVYSDRRSWIVLNPELEDDMELLSNKDLGDIEIVSKNDNNSLWVLKCEKDVQGISYYLFNRVNKDFQLIFYGSPQLLDYKFCEMKPIKFTARDGLEITGYLTMPKEKQGKVPLVVNVHGGPQSREYWGFNPFVQWIASQGYACLQINFRGSIGFGKEFVRKGYKQWGGDMLNDVLDGTQWAVDNFNIDPERIGMYGGSYGGFTALSGVTFNPDKFKCGISVNGPSNLFTFLENMPPFWKKYESCFYERIGHPELDMELLKLRSPLFSCGNIKCPVLIVQGARDARVNSMESESIVKKMEEHGIDYSYLLIEDEGHGIRKNVNKIKLYSKIEEFLLKYL